MAKFKITWIADVPEPTPLCILGAGIKMIRMPREFSEIVEAETLEGSLALLNRVGARCIEVQPITAGEPKWQHSQGNPVPRASHYKGPPRG